MQAFGRTENASFRPYLGRTTKRTRLVRRGERIFNARRHHPKAYTLVRGEILILRRGLLVDLVEPGEFLDIRYWPGAHAVARPDCRLAVVDP